MNVHNIKYSKSISFFYSMKYLTTLKFPNILLIEKDKISIDKGREY